MSPLLSDPALLPRQPDMPAATFAAQDLLELRFSSPLFRLGTESAIQQKLSFPDGGPDQHGGRHRDGDRRHRRHRRRPGRRAAAGGVQRIIANPEQIAGAEGMELSEVQADGRDPVVQETVVEGDTATVPGRTVAVLVLPQT